MGECCCINKPPQVINKTSNWTGMTGTETIHNHVTEYPTLIPRNDRWIQ